MKKRSALRWCLGIGLSGLLPSAAPWGLADTSVHVGIHRHLHQPNYWGEPATTAGRPKQSQYGQDSQALKDANQAYYGDTIQHPEVQLVGGNSSVFENPDKQQAYQVNIKKSIGAMTSSDAGMTISFSGALQRNLWSFGRYSQAGYSPSWNADNVAAYGWKTSGGVHSRAQVLGQTYHHAFTPLLPESALRKEIEMQKERTRKSWGLAADMSDQPVGFWPIELAFSEHLIPILAEYGYQWVMIPNSHLARTCPNYMEALAQPSPGAELKADPPNRADQLGPTVPLTQWYGANRDTYGNVFPVPFAYQLHKAKFVDPETGVETKMTVVPQCDYHGYQSGYAAVGWDFIDGKIAQYNNPDQPCLVMLTNDGENYWGGGSSFWNEFAPNFMNSASSHGKKAITIPDFVAAHPAPESDIVHVEDGSWLAADQGSPQFYRWLEPPRRISGIDWSNPNSIFDLENGWHSDMRNWAVMLAGVNHCETAEQIFEAGGGEVLSWRIEEPYQDDGTDNNPNAAEQAWHFLLWGFDSGFMYFGDTLDDEVKHTVAANRAISIASNVIGNASADTTAPTVFKPQRFPWNPGGKGKGQYLGGLTTGGATVGFTTAPWSSDFYIWTLAYDVSGLNTVTLKIRLDADGTNPLNNNANETYAGGPGVGSWISIPMTRRAMPKNDPTGNSNLNFYVLPNQISDYCWAKVSGYRGALLDYYIEATDSKGNTSKSDIQHVYVEDDGTSGGVSPSAAFDPAAPSDCASITVTFNASTSSLANAATVYAFHHFSTNSSDWTNAVMTRATSNTFTLTFSTVPDNAPHLEVCFNDGANWENNGGANWKVNIRDCDAPEFVNGVCILPAVPTAGQGATILYDPTGRALASATNVNIHHGYNNSNWTVAPGVAMAKSNAYWTFSYTVPVAATSIVMCFNNSSTWDNNSSANWTFAVNPTSVPSVPNGIVITNPAVATANVANATTAYTLQGTAGTNLTGNLLWTNAATASSGSFTRETYWSHSINLGEGDNPITLSAVIAGTESGQITNASDSVSNAAYSGGWTNGSNGGTGFGAWTLYHDANAGHFASTNNGWGFWSHEGTNLSEAVRSLSNALATGQTFHVRMKNGWIENSGSIGVALRNTNGATLWQLYFNGGDNYYNSATNVTDINWTDAGLDIDFTLTGPGAYAVQIQPVGGTARQYSGTFSGEIAQFRAWSYNNGKNDTNNWQRDFFVNHLRVTRPGAGGGESYSTATVHILREASSHPSPVISDIELDLGGGGLEFNLTNSVSGATYAIWASSTLIPTQNWQVITGTEVLANGGNVDLSLTNGLLPTNFYRIGYTMP